MNIVIFMLAYMLMKVKDFEVTHKIYVGLSERRFLYVYFFIYR